MQLAHARSYQKQNNQETERSANTYCACMWLDLSLQLIMIDQGCLVDYAYCTIKPIACFRLVSQAVFSTETAMLFLQTDGHPHPRNEEELG